MSAAVWFKATIRSSANHFDRDLQQHSPSVSSSVWKSNVHHFHHKNLAQTRICPQDLTHIFIHHSWWRKPGQRVVRQKNMVPFWCCPKFTFSTFTLGPNLQNSKCWRRGNRHFWVECKLVYVRLHLSNAARRCGKGWHSGSGWGHFRHLFFASKPYLKVKYW